MNEQLHAQLSLIDVIKDAFYNYNKNINIQSGFDMFYKCIKLMYKIKKNDIQYANRIKYLDEIITKKTYDIPIKINTIMYSSSEFMEYIPDYIQYSIQDSGQAPDSFKFDTINVITPASYIDPASRGGGIMYGFDKIISKDVFQQLGIPFIEKFSSKLDKETNDCSINIIFNINGNILEFNTVINTKYKPILGNTDYFYGNDQKNRWFDLQNTVNKKSIEEGIIYIICKELGDTLQAYYGKVFMNELDNSKKKNICLFTCDNMLARRGRLMDLSVIVKDYKKQEKDIHECLYYPYSTILNHNKADTITNEIKREYIKQINDNNSRVVQRIKIMIELGYILYNKKKIKINKALLKLFETIRYKLDRQIKIFRLTNTTFMTIDEYREFNEHSNAINLFRGKKDQLEIIGDVHNIFKGKKDNTIMEYGANLGEVIEKLSTKEGGSKKYSFYDPDVDIVYEYEEKYTDEELKKAPINIQLENKIYWLLNERYPDNHRKDTNWNDELNTHTNDLKTLFIFDQLYLYFRFVGETMMDKQFLSDMIDIYEKDHMNNLTYQQFKDLYYARKKELTGEEPPPNYDFSKQFEEMDKIEKRLDTDPEYKEYFDKLPDPLTTTIPYITFEEWKNTKNVDMNNGIPEYVMKHTLPPVPKEILVRGGETKKKDKKAKKAKKAKKYKKATKRLNKRNTKRN